MQLDHLRCFLDDASQAEPWLRSLGIRDAARGHGNLVGLAKAGITIDLLHGICDQLQRELPGLSDPDMALNNLERFITAARSALAIGTLFQRDPESLTTLLQIFSTSQYLGDLLISDTESYDLLRLTEGQPVARDDLVEELVSEIDVLSDDRAVMSALRRFKRRETLRIAYGDIVRGQPLRTVTRQISYVAEAILEGALRCARRTLEQKRGVPTGRRAARVPFVVLALGKLGGGELNYSSDIDLICLYGEEGRTDAHGFRTNHEFFQRLVREIIRLLTESHALGTTYRVDLRLRPEGAQGAAACTVDSALRYYDLAGRTWERQAYVKANPVAGDLELGHAFLKRLEPWIYRRYLSLADITGIKALKRRIERRTDRKGDAARNVKIGHGGIRDIEFVIQFLQLLNGAALPELHTGNTLEAITRLEQTGCLTFQERTILEDNYAFLRKIEHRLQILFDLQTHVLPEQEDERRKLAIRMGYADSPCGQALTAFDTDYTSKTAENRRILDHLLHDAFGDDPGAEPEVDLVNDPDPPPDRIVAVMTPYGFRDSQAAYRHLMTLAREKIRFLSTRRSRHFLASIAPRLLKAISQTPDPDATLVNLNRVSDSLGGKSALWELLSTSQPSLDLCVKLCAACPYLAGILTSNPGMIDELVDSLLLQNLPSLESLENSLTDLCRGAEDIDPILHSFKDAQHLRVGVRDILGKDDIRATHGALAATAEVCLKQIACGEQTRLLKKFGRPTIADGQHGGEPCHLAILALGKLGGCEPNYHSDVDIVFLYDAEGMTVAEGRAARGKITTNSHFFSEWAQRIIKVASHLGPHGRLYEVDVRLRPTGGSGSLAVSIDGFRRYFEEGAGQLWERQALCKGRVIFGPPATARRVMETVARVTYGPVFRVQDAQEIRHMRTRLEQSASPRNLKRGPGGTMDIEFLVQMLQLKHGGDLPSIRRPGTLAALLAIHQQGLLPADDYEYFDRSYRFLRSVEAHIRLMKATGRHELPADETQLGKLAYLLGATDAPTLAKKTHAVLSENRRRFDRLFSVAMK